MLDEEERDDTQMRERFKEKWVPKPSAELTTQIRQEAAKYQGILQNAINADSIVREKYNAHRRAMDLLCKSEVRFGVTAEYPATTYHYCSTFNRAFIFKERRMRRNKLPTMSGYSAVI